MLTWRILWFMVYGFKSFSKAKQSKEKHPRIVRFRRERVFPKFVSEHASIAAYDTLPYQYMNKSCIRK